MSYQTWRCWRALPIAVTLAVALTLCFGNDRAIADPNHEADTANWIALPLSGIDGFFPTPWSCSGAAPSSQSVLQFHRNWHCANPDNTGPNWGNRFFGFHKQFLLGYDRYLTSVGEPHIQTWVAAPGALIPPAHSGRPADAPCTTCQALPSSFKLPAAGGTLDGFASVTAIGDAIVGWHNTNHGRIAAAGGTGSCSASSADMNCPSWSPRDPIFYRYHHIFDDVQDAWRTHQATDIAIVFDRSGSMSLPTSGGGTRLDAAKSAASLFADLLEDGSSHRLGLVTFSTTASSPATMPLTTVAGAPATLTAALAGVTASGNTSIGDGLQKAQTLVAGGSNARKAMLLLTDGMENTAPTIATAQGGLGDTHICSVGFGTPGGLDGPKLRDLSERQGGIYISTPNSLELKKFFVFCFADIFDTFVGEDPIETLPGATLASTATIHTAYEDHKLVFVLSWTNPLPKGTLRLAITTPSGSPVKLTDPAVESTFGPTWHIVRVKTPFQGEGNGQWEARAVRPHRGYVNGFSSNAFVDFAQGAALVRSQVARLCPNGCKAVLYYEDEMVHDTFEDHNSIYATALYGEVGRGIIGTVTKPRSPAEFATALKARKFDLLVYSSQFTEKEQPYDDILSRVLCSRSKPLSIISDNRETQSAQAILRCAGALRGEAKNFTGLQGKELLHTSEATLKEQHHVSVFSYEVRPTSGNSLVQAMSDQGAAAVLTQGISGKDEEFFITALTRGTSRVKPFTYRSQYYTFESLHPTFHIPEMYWPDGGYDTIEASVDVTRPAQSTGRMLAEVGLKEGSTVKGDALSPRQTVLVRQEQAGAGVKTETKRFPLFDDGTNGDGTANDHYWEVSIPEDFAAHDGQYQLHAYFRLCKGGICVNREAEQTITVQTKLSEKTTFTVEPQRSSRGRKVTRVRFTPVDHAGMPMGPGLIDSLLVTGQGDVRITAKRDADGRGTYEIFASWTDSKGAPILVIQQAGRPKDAHQVKLSE
ncbi:MAG: exported protein of unknown function [Candidatus Nitrospira kreftii]|uniref:VWFA domain-containing protein n=1 Tax=Candidatus Nitrospira kreftii TaxID=2652173 RepID=A0A7S8FHB6_9BACT|nr:MAG: exported protein of unknown function [Candidatus Nitrospira kreftii]